MKQTLSNEYLYVIYDTLYPVLEWYAGHLIKQRFNTYNVFKFFTVQDFIQVGLEGISTLPDGLPISVYVSRAKNRMKNYARDLRAKKRDEMILLEFKDIFQEEKLYYEQNEGEINV